MDREETVADMVDNRVDSTIAVLLAQLEQAQTRTKMNTSELQRRLQKAELAITMAKYDQKIDQEGLTGEVDVLEDCNKAITKDRDALETALAVARVDLQKAENRADADQDDLAAFRDA